MTCVGPVNVPPLLERCGVRVWNEGGITWRLEERSLFSGGATSIPSPGTSA